MNFDQKTFQKNQLTAFALGAVFCAGIATFVAATALFVSLGAYCFLVIGFKLSENFVRLAARIKKPGVTELFGIVAKLFWFFLVFYFSRKPELRGSTPVAIGMGSFLLSLVVLGFAQYGIKNDHDALKSPSNP